MGALIFAVSMGRPLVLRHNTVLSFPFDSVITFFEEETLIEQGLLPPAAARNSSTIFTVNAFTAEGIKLLSCGNWQEELGEFRIIKYQGAYGIHLPLINPHVGLWLQQARHVNTHITNVIPTRTLPNRTTI